MVLCSYIECYFKSKDAKPAKWFANLTTYGVYRGGYGFLNGKPWTFGGSNSWGDDRYGRGNGCNCKKGFFAKIEIYALCLMPKVYVRTIALKAREVLEPWEEGGLEPTCQEARRGRL